MTIFRETLAVFIFLATLSAQARLASGSLIQKRTCSPTDSSRILQLCLASVEGETGDFLLIHQLDGKTRVLKFMGGSGVPRSDRAQLQYLHYNGTRSFLREIGRMNERRELVLNESVEASIDGGNLVGTVLVERNGIRLLAVQLELKGQDHVKGVQFSSSTLR